MACRGLTVGGRLATQAAGAHAGALGLLWREGAAAISPLWRAGAVAMPAQQRSVGHVHGDRLMGNVLKAWENREISKVVDKRDPKYFEDFEVGDSVLVLLVNPYQPTRVQPFSGICIEKRREKLLGASFTLRNHLEGYAVEQQIAYWSPLLKAVLCIGKPQKRPKRSRLFYLRDRPSKESTVEPSKADLARLPKF